MVFAQNFNMVKGMGQNRRCSYGLILVTLIQQLSGIVTSYRKLQIPRGISVNNQYNKQNQQSIEETKPHVQGLYQQLLILKMLRI